MIIEQTAAEQRSSRRLKEPDRAVCFVFIDSYGRGGGVGRGLGVSCGLCVGEGVAVDVAVGVGDRLAVGVAVAVALVIGVGVAVAVDVAVAVALDVAVAVGVGVVVAVEVGVGVTVEVEVGVDVGVGVGPDWAQYLPPVFSMVLGCWPASCGRAVGVETACPPQTIISLPVHAAVCAHRAVGASFVVVAVQLSVLGLYLPPVPKRKNGSNPPQTIISLPVQTAV